MRLALAQLDVVVGDIEGNRDRIVDVLGTAREADADLVVFPELAVTGYPPEDLLLRPAFVRAAHAAVGEIARATEGLVALVGTPWLDRDLANACAVCADGAVRAVYRKHFLPNYGVFDEHRYFGEGRELVLLRLGETYVGLTICEDVWQPGPPATDLALAGAQLIVNLSASPFHVGKAEEREEMLVTRARDTSAYVAFCNLVGGQDELVFDGHSVVLDDSGTVVARAPGFEEHLLVVDVSPELAIGRRLRDIRRRELERSRETAPEVRIVELAGARGAGHHPASHPVAPFEPELEQMRRALTLGLRDYVDKNGFHDVVVGVSGGIDSALTAALCADALGPERVHCVSMPSRFTSEGTRTDARRLAEALGCDFREIPIEAMVETFRRELAEATGGLRGLADENLQARVRGVVVMALSNTYGWLVVSTGNKSELAVGYATLYGDMVGGFALLKDVFKTDVFRLARYLNERAGRELIPASTIERAPSAELRPDQRDEDSLPPYELLDPVLEAYVERDRSREELLEEFDPEVVERAVALVDRAEYKRRQAPPGVKLRPKAFGRDRRTPITNRWRD
ncbi:MAG: putative glutamine-dependent NAD(+) synthetase [Gaiellaceae bacterium]|nr:MAG: putative glutamine-dependent NAD(+) synthetase [Gaiellaceae bacterium]